MNDEISLELIENDSAKLHISGVYQLHFCYN